MSDSAEKKVDEIKSFCTLIFEEFSKSNDPVLRMATIFEIPEKMISDYIEAVDSGAWPPLLKK